MLLLKNGKILTMDDNKVIHGDILVGDGKIKKIDSCILSTEAKKIDLKNSVVTPGFIDAHTSLGVVESGKGFAGDDLNEKNDSVTPHLSVKDGVNVFDRSFEEAVKSGITSTLICPGSAQVVAGRCGVYKTHVQSLKDMAYKEPAGLQINLGDEPKNSNKGKIELPMSRMGLAYLIRKLFKESVKYIENGSPNSYKDYDIKYESLRELFSKEIPMIVSADRVQDILTAINIAEEFEVNLVLQSCTEGHLIVEELAKRKIPVLLGPYLTDYSNRELENRNYSSAAIMSKAGILTCIVTNHPDVPVELLSINAAIAVREGLSYEDGLKSITINPAKVLGIDHRVGSISEGKDGDIAIFDGDPLKVKTKTLMTIIDGHIVYES